MVGQRRCRKSVNPGTVHSTRDFHDGVVRQVGESPPVRNVEDEFSGHVVGDGVHDRKGDLVVSTSFQIGLVALELPRDLAIGGHVRFFALEASGLPQSGDIVSVLGLGVEAPLLGLQKRPARSLGIPVDGEVVARIVVIVQVLVGYGAQGLHQIRTEEPTFLKTPDEVGALHQTRQDVDAVDLQAGEPAQVIEPAVSDVDASISIEQGTQVSRCQPGILQGGEGATGQADRGVTDTDHLVSKAVLHDLGHHASRISEVDDLGMGGVSRYLFDEVEHHRDTPQGI